MTDDGVQAGCRELSSVRLRGSPGGERVGDQLLMSS
jgi:hypothetical protein